MNGYSSMDIDENDDDELLYEIDVQLHRTEQSIYLFQYPIRPYYRKYDETSFTNARIKEKHSLVEMDLLVDTQSSNYYLSRGKQFADSTNNDNGKQYFNSDRMDKQTIASTNSTNGKIEFFIYSISSDKYSNLRNNVSYTIVLFVEINRLVMCLYSLNWIGEDKKQLIPFENFLNPSFIAHSIE
jgi:hypothetical protein